MQCVCAARRWTSYSISVSKDHASMPQRSPNTTPEIHSIPKSGPSPHIDRRRCRCVCLLAWTDTRPVATCLDPRDDTRSYVRMTTLGVADVARCLLGILVGRSMAYLFVRRQLKHSDDYFSTADNVYSIFFHSFITFLAIDATASLSGTSIMDASSAELRWQGTTRNSNLYLWLFCIDNVVHMPLQLSKDVPVAKHATVIAHHVLSNLSYATGLRSQRLHFWATLAGLCEVTNPLLSIVFMMKELGLADKRSGPWPRVFQLSSLLTWVAFLVFRLLLFPLWLVLFFYDMAQHPACTDSTSLPERVCYPLALIAVLLMSVSWMIPLTQGLIKVLRGEPEAEAASSDSRKKAK